MRYPDCIGSPEVLGLDGSEGTQHEQKSREDADRDGGRGRARLAERWQVLSTRSPQPADAHRVYTARLDMFERSSFADPEVGGYLLDG